MHDKNEKNTRGREGGAEPLGFVDRRQTPASKEPLFRVMVILNVSAWFSLLGALVLFHYARPEFISGVQKFWGVEGRIYWSQAHVDGLLATLQVCLGLSLVSMILRLRRNRRKTDNFGINLFILLAITVISLITLYTTMYM
ncbi:MULTISPECIES: hypothetical protein [Alteromonadaceae]|jgi:hypothetical protein|uniref:Uncharacterized protein n=1 Tax=Brumicola blandensis TaxID=3075611 RepID=A0AAW8QV82_9ALTE|nr:MULTISPECIES: hypothetical protein [unclassified Alteromonas]MDT0581073.1 hypothetical protein [Alteromonas sp. W409]MDT0629500.1 hypothetical protein [Alteromonas sp. W364]